MTAGDVIDRVKANLGAPWREATYRDTFKFGGPDTRVTGIATTAFVTLEVIEKAAAAGLNMIIPHEVTYWNDRDDVSALGGDAIYQRKIELLKKHDMAVFRMHDHMHVQRPDFTFVGSARDIGFDSKYETAPGSHVFVLPERYGSSATPRPRSAGCGSASATARRRSIRPMSTWSSAANSRKPTAPSTAPPTCWTP
jgi:hypothetical protein